MYKLYISNKARKEFKKISNLHQQVILLTLQEIKDDPLSGKPLSRELTGKFSFKIGVYRIVYTVNKQDKIIQIITAGHRSTVYN